MESLLLSSGASAGSLSGTYISSPEVEGQPYSWGVGASDGGAAYAQRPDPAAGGQGNDPVAGGPPLRVIHVNACLLPAGIEYWISSLSRYANPQRLRFLRNVVTGSQVYEEQIPRLGMPVEIGGLDSLRQAVDDCDVLLISDTALLTESAARLFRDLRPKLGLLVAHGDGPWTRHRVEHLGPVVDQVIAVSPKVERSVCRGFPTTTILNGVDPQRLVQTRPREEIRDELGFAPDDFVLGYLGRFSDEKNPAGVIDAVARLPRSFKALMVGFGHLRQDLMERANRLIPCRCAFANATGNLGDVYAAMDAFCLPSLYEGYGLAAMEAAMCGRPVITTPTGFAVDYIVHGVNGFVVDPSPDAIAGVVRKLADNPQWSSMVCYESKKLAQRIGFASTMARRYETVIQKLWTDKHGAGNSRLAATVTATSMMSSAFTTPSEY